MNDEQATVEFLARSALAYREMGNVSDAALTLGVKALIERLIKERDAARSQVAIFESFKKP